jgi:diaminopimelate epimerase
MNTIHKLTGAGNNFLLVDLRRPHKARIPTSRARWARELCNTYESIGADGLVILEDSSKADVKWDFYNADGSRAEMCGNAARCVGRYIMLFPKKINAQLFTLETRAGVVQVSTPKKAKRGVHIVVPVLVDMPVVKEFSMGHKVKVGHKAYTFDYIQSGVPHAVVKDATGTNLLKKLTNPVDNLGDIVNKIRSLTQFKRHGVNVTFFSRNRENKIESATFERGVVGYTQACGTGAVAAAVSYLVGTRGAVWVAVPGGKLYVDLRGHNPQLLGPAKYIGEIKI